MSKIDMSSSSGLVEHPPPMEVQLMIGIAAHASEFPCSTPEFQLTTPSEQHHPGVD